MKRLMYTSDCPTFVGKMWSIKELAKKLYEDNVVHSINFFLFYSESQVFALI